MLPSQAAREPNHHAHTFLKSAADAEALQRWNSRTLMVILTLTALVTFSTSCSRITAKTEVRSTPVKLVELDKNKTVFANPSPAGLTFRQIAIADGRTHDGFSFADYHFKASDCVRVSERVVFYGSAERAVTGVRNEITRASEILDRGPMFDNLGQQIGERAVLQFAKVGQTEGYSVIVSNSGSQFQEINSSSMRHLLDFEKSSSDLTSNQASARIVPTQNLTFETITTSQGESANGVQYSERVIQSSDCETLRARTEYYATPELAEAALKSRLKDATGIFEEGPNSAASGPSSGYRAVATFKADPDAEYVEKTAVLRTDGRTLLSIEGLYTYALEFETRLSQLASN